jgi:transposase
MVGSIATAGSVPDCIGMDVHAKTCTWTAIDSSGNPIQRKTCPTNRKALAQFAQGVAPSVRIGIEASTAGLAVFRLLRDLNLDVHLGSPRKLKAITDSDVKTDKKDSADLAHLLQMNYFPDCYVPPPDIERIRQLVRHRMRLGQSLTVIKNQVHALVIKNLFQSQMDGHSDWFGKSALAELVKLPFNEDDRNVLRSLLEQVKLLVKEEERMERDLAKLGETIDEVRLLMTIPGIDFYSALAIVGEIGDVHRYPSKGHLCSDAGVVPQSDNSGEHISKHRRVKRGNKILKYFLCNAVHGMISSRRETAVTKFYKKKAKQIGEGKAKVAAARKLAAIIWRMLTDNIPYVEEDPELTSRKVVRMERTAKSGTSATTDDELVSLALDLGAKEVLLKRMAPGDDSQ